MLLKGIVVDLRLARVNGRFRGREEIQTLQKSGWQNSVPRWHNWSPAVSEPRVTCSTLFAVEGSGVVDMLGKRKDIQKDITVQVYDA